MYYNFIKRIKLSCNIVNMQLSFTLLLVSFIMITLIIVLRNQLVNRLVFFRKSKQYEQYTSHILSDKTQLHTVLSEYNNSLSEKKIEIITKNSSYSKGNFTQKIRSEIMPIINNVLNTINKLGNNRLKFIELDRIEKLEDAHNNTQYLIGLFVHSVDASVTNKLILNYYNSSDHTIYINSLKQESITAHPSTQVDTLNSVSNNLSYGAPHTHIRKNITNPSKLRIHEPCKYTLNIWDNHGVNKQLKLRERCRITNNSQTIHPTSLYVNPTIFSPMFGNPPPEYTI